MARSTYAQKTNSFLMQLALGEIGFMYLLIKLSECTRGTGNPQEKRRQEALEFIKKEQENRLGGLILDSQGSPYRERKDIRG